MMKRVLRFIVYTEYRIQCEVQALLWLDHYRVTFLLAYLLRKHLSRVRYVRIAKKATIGRNLQLPHPHNIIIGMESVVGDNCRIYHDVTVGQSKGKFPKLGNRVIVYAGARIIGDVNIGDNAIIGANAVVTHDVPANAIVGGIPAKIIRYRREDDVFY